MASLLDLAEARLRGLLDIPTRAARAIVNPTAFSGLLGGPTLPKEQGFAEAAFGLPARENMSVLDPTAASYMQGYSAGEPMAYLGMATPFAAPAAVAGAKAVAPKAGMALENYMAAQGLLQPLTAYHGTPHNIQGKFDISKVGTGEGAQSYGHGMYFAEAPDVAKTYMTVGGKGEYVRIGDKVVPTASQEGQLLADVNKLGRKAAINKYPDQADFIKTINPDQIKFEGGNLYKVDIPDEYIPTMMDYDKPLGEQNEIVKKALNQIKKQITPEMKMELGGDLDLLFGKDVTPVQFLNTMEIIHPTGGVGIGEKMLNDLGVKGIRYKDAMSRGADKGTSNFVIFDPSEVKILEKNKKKIEGLLD